MIKRMGNRGEIGFDTIIYVIVAGIAAVLIALYMYGFFDTLSEGMKTFTPAQTDMKFNACSAYATPGAIDTFCRYDEIKGTKNTYLNCEYKEIKERLSKEGIDTSGLSCSETPIEFCEEMKTEKGDSFNDLITVNGETCSEMGVLKSEPVAN